MEIHNKTPVYTLSEAQDKATLKKAKRGVPKQIIIYTADEEKSRDIIAKAMAEMYRRMIDPV